ncbi:MAG: hypothetical protein HOV80_07780 [Polyangiaceae bacterium]|nr:hypothetical protein [Polyangiaceae bacterium]
MRAPTLRTLLAATFVALVAAVGCSSSGGNPPQPTGKAAECQRFAAIVNAAKIGASIGKDKAQLETEAKNAVMLDQDIGKLEITDAELKRLVTEYRGNVTAYATVMSDGAEALEGDLDGLVKIMKSASVIAEKNVTVTQQIKAYCTAK